jgi:N-acyl-D-aspartate/D-glutamate deacylase
MREGRLLEGAGRGQVTRIGLGDSGAHLTSIMDGGFFPFFLMHFVRIGQRHRLL